MRKRQWTRSRVQMRSIPRYEKEGSFQVSLENESFLEALRKSANDFECSRCAPAPQFSRVFLAVDASTGAAELPQLLRT